MHPLHVFDSILFLARVPILLKKSVYGSRSVEKILRIWASGLLPAKPTALMSTLDQKTKPSTSQPPFVCVRTAVGGSRGSQSRVKPACCASAQPSIGNDLPLPAACSSNARPSTGRMGGRQCGAKRASADQATHQ